MPHVFSLPSQLLRDVVFSASRSHSRACSGVAVVPASPTRSSAARSPDVSRRKQPRSASVNAAERSPRLSRTSSLITRRLSGQSLTPADQTDASRVNSRTAVEDLRRTFPPEPQDAGGVFDLVSSRLPEVRSCLVHDLDLAEQRG